MRAWAIRFTRGRGGGGGGRWGREVGGGVFHSLCM